MKPFYLSSGTVLPIKPFYLSNSTCTATQSKETGRKHCAAKLEDMRDEDVLEDGAYGIGAAAGMAASIASSAFYLVADVRQMRKSRQGL